MWFIRKFKFDINRYPFRLELSKPIVQREGVVHAVISLPPNGNYRVMCKVLYTGLYNFDCIVKIPTSNEAESQGLYCALLEAKDLPLVAEFRNGSVIVKDFDIRYFSTWHSSVDTFNELSRTTNQLEIQFPIPNLDFKPHSDSISFDYPHLAEINESFKCLETTFSSRRMKEKHEDLMATIHGFDFDNLH